jgi:hypothetical protein
MQGDQKGDRLPFATAPKDILENVTHMNVKKANRETFYFSICLRNPRIACSTDHVSNIPLIEQLNI